jgi:hypothetical protein
VQTMNFIFVLYYIFIMHGGMEISPKHVLFLGMFWKLYDVLSFQILANVSVVPCISEPRLLSEWQLKVTVVWGFD